VRSVHPFFSIVIPTYNRASKLKFTLNSVIAQTFTDFEVLIMDDGSTDNTEAVVESFHDSRMRYEWAPNSGGPATPRNRGIDASRADWICFLDADDRWYPDKLKRVSEIVTTTSGLDLVCHDEIMVALATGRRIPAKCGPFVPDFYRVMLMWGNRVSTSAVSVRRDFLNKHCLRFNQSPDYVIVEDYDMWLRIAFHRGVFHFIADYYGEYVIADDNISSNSQRIQSNHLTLLRDHVYNVQSFQPDKNRLWRELNAGVLVTKAKSQLSKNQFILAAGSLMLALRYSFSWSFKYILMKTFNKRRIFSRRLDGNSKAHARC
jgi:glycosyltransferase involved in cell wall biosynthesis